MSVQDTTTAAVGRRDHARPSRTSRSPASACPVAVVRWLGRIKGAAARVNAELGLLDADARRARSPPPATRSPPATHDDQFPIDVFQTGSGTSSNMNANEVIADARRRRRAPQRPREHGPVVQRRLPQRRAPRRARRGDQRAAARARAARGVASRAKAEAFKDIVKSGRTHLMDAVPGHARPGVRAATPRRSASARERVAQRARRRSRRSRSAAPRPAPASTRTPSSPSACARELADGDRARRSAPPEDPFEAQANRDALVELSGALKVVAVSLTKIANDLALMGSGPRAGHRRALPARAAEGLLDHARQGQPGDPRGRAPGRRAGDRQRHRDHVGGLQGQFELNVRIPLIARNLLQSIAPARRRRRRCSPRSASTASRPTCEGCERSAEGTLAVATALNPYIGYDKAAEIVKEASASGPHAARGRARARRRRGDARQGARPAQDRRRLEGRGVSGLEKRGGSRPSRRAREQRAYRLVQIGGAAGLVAVVGAILAIVGVLGWGLGRAGRRSSRSSARCCSAALRAEPLAAPAVAVAQVVRAVVQAVRRGPPRTRSPPGAAGSRPSTAGAGRRPGSCSPSSRERVVEHLAVRDRRALARRPGAEPASRAGATRSTRRTPSAVSRSTGPSSAHLALQRRASSIASAARGLASSSRPLRLLVVGEERARPRSSMPLQQHEPHRRRARRASRWRAPWPRARARPAATRVARTSRGPASSGLASHRHRDVLGLQVLVDALGAALAAEAGRLTPPNGAAGVGDDALVEADHAGLEPLADAERALEVAACRRRRRARTRCRWRPRSPRPRRRTPITGATGPKISSLSSRASPGTPASTVGS